MKVNGKSRIRIHMKTSDIFLIVGLFLCVGFLHSSCLPSSGSGGDTGWGRGKMKPSERRYYQDRFRIIMDRSLSARRSMPSISRNEPWRQMGEKGETRDRHA